MNKPYVKQGDIVTITRFDFGKTDFDSEKMTFMLFAKSGDKNIKIDLVDYSAMDQLLFQADSYRLTDLIGRKLIFVEEDTEYNSKKLGVYIVK